MSQAPVGLNEYEKSAIHHFFLHTTLPIIGWVDKVSCIIATGTLFKIVGRHFLITAAHTTESFPPDNWSYPSAPSKGQVYAVGGCNFFTPTEDGLDVAVIELHEPHTIATLTLNWRFLSLDNVWLPDLSANAVLLAGYPSERVTHVGDNLHGKVFVLRQQFRDGTPESAAYSEALNTGIDFFLNYENAVSGCSVWAYRQRGWAAHTFWSPEVSLRVVGIQSAFVENKYIRAKSWGAVLHTLSRVDEQLHNEVRTFVNRFFELTGYKFKDGENG
jgi:hypothetical protein